MDKKLLVVGVMAILGTSGAGAQAALLSNGDLLAITAGVPTYDGNGNQIGIASGSWFGMDNNGNSSISNSEKSLLYPGTDGGVIIGATQSPGQIDYWGYGSSPGYDSTTVAPTGGTTSGITFSGWTFTPSGFPPINMGGGAWGTGFSNGIANFVWDGVYGNAYTLDYAATIPAGDPSGFGGVKYRLHLEGVVSSAVTVPAAVWLFGSGLLGLVGFARRGRD